MGWGSWSVCSEVPGSDTTLSRYRSNECGKAKYGGDQLCDLRGQIEQDVCNGELMILNGRK